MTKLMIVDDNEIMREGLKVAITRTKQYDLVGEATDGREAVDKAVRLQPDVILMDIRMPYSGLRATKDILEQLPDTKILMLTVSEEETDLIDSIKCGARGYVLKGIDSGDLMLAIRTIADGGVIFTSALAHQLLDDIKSNLEKPREEYGLTRRETEVLELISEGLSNKEIALKLNIGESTVKAHLHNILTKLHLKNRSQAAVFNSKRNRYDY
ncbi:MAG: response regulator transcription factor [Dehalococcoidales bacterium]|nr:response regulator transcription factor [Dehalococcoidales bacterium]